ncbi:DegT/DnrJ/EryC1/StrS family aminotransferase [Gemmatimonas sp.]|uniref:DegT/DnrJ/EryC1/StrS family aminotransferase n=1 Tax=Gemmatimonas sp. TaxID=1962908 RepID=UPI0037C133E5
MSTLLRFPPVYTAVQWSAIADAAWTTASGSGKRGVRRAAEMLEERYHDRRALLTDSGTSALTLALRMSTSGTPPSNIVALPGYACPDIATAAIGAGFRIVLYDVDQDTLEPITASVRRCLQQGATHLVVVHLYGRLVNVTPFAAMAMEFGATLIEDAAQSAWGLHQRARGPNIAPFAVVSFGRGKGVNAGGGGALLMHAAVADADPLPPVSASSAWKSLVVTAASELLSAPWLYAIPAAVPALGVGQTVYHDPQPARSMSAPCVRLLRNALEQENSVAAARRVHAARYRAALATNRALLFTEGDGSTDGALRFPVRLEREPSPTLARLGVSRSYPRTLLDYPAVQRHLTSTPDDLTGSRQLAASTYTLPTHSRIDEPTRDAILRQLRLGDGQR